MSNEQVQSKGRLNRLSRDIAAPKMLPCAFSGTPGGRPYYLATSCQEGLWRGRGLQLLPAEDAVAATCHCDQRFVGARWREWWGMLHRNSHL